MAHRPVHGSNRAIRWVRRGPSCATSRLMSIQTLLLRSAFAMALLVGCGGPLKYDVKGSQLSPGSDAHLVADVDKGRSVTSVEIEAKNLTPAERLVDGGKTYVIWVRKGSDAAWSRAGALELKSEGREGKAKLTVPETAFDLEVTAEAAASVASPSGKVVFEQKVGN
jgi:hypothetical protein